MEDESEVDDEDEGLGDEDENEVDDDDGDGDDGDDEYGDDGDDNDDGDDGDEESMSVSEVSLDDSLVRSVVELGEASRQHSKNAGSQGMPNEKLLKEHPLPNDPVRIPGSF